ncbi:precorrin-6y C5,15-methyltransferase (decarboxylating) subunit CbiE [Leucothrix arctica]|uniref:Cobalamin biosynthesis bifunctional protein CbiET n=1 Tax=Leucothrix arctica TaxID=1481894 RepID=A0A317CAI1_9GAMM|nr:precorrin-6y C5,15-methyltransferase (decarboxylating) subunit CbiE [Leucothrix arctica]PWQ95536.1 cobalamin biosynthesis bifunctional protein CbiET [Leucothrix arctica]
MQPFIHIIGLGVTETEQLSTDALDALAQAALVVGSKRQLEIVKPKLVKQTTSVLPKLNQLKSLIEHSNAQHVVILASGDPLYYGIGRWFSKQFTPEQLRYYPAVSSIQAACHSIGLSLQATKVISLHGRPVLTLRRHLAQQRYLVILTDQHSSPQALAALCHDAGFSQSRLWVCEQLGYENQKVREFSVDELVNDSTELQFDPLHVTIIKVTGETKYLPSFPGIPDHHFITDSDAGRGLITKREVRLAILSLLQPAPDDIGWDIGAGCGGVAVEWALWNQLGNVHAIEHHPQRFECLEQNQQRFGVVDNLKTVQGRAPEVLSHLPAANKIFIGGSDGELPVLLGSLWRTLPDGGVIVASAVMETSRTQLIHFAEKIERDVSDSESYNSDHGQTLPQGEVETLQVAISRGGKLAGQLLYRPSLPVTLFKFIKPHKN